MTWNVTFHTHLHMQIITFKFPDSVTRHSVLVRIHGNTRKILQKKQFIPSQNIIKYNSHATSILENLSKYCCMQ